MRRHRDEHEPTRTDRAGQRRAGRAPPRTYRERDGDGTELKVVVVVVTTETKKVANGVTGRVVRYLGEDTAEFEGGTISSKAGSVEAGVNGAPAGIAMPANPQPGMRYRQEYLKGEAEDNGEVLGVNEIVEIALGLYGALLTKNTRTIEPDVAEYKLYAKGVGPVLVLGISGGGGREELISVDKAPASAGTGPLGSPNP